MAFPTDERLILVRNALVQGERASLYERARQGALTRIAPGVFTPSAVWNAAHPEERHRLLIHAVLSTTEQDLVVSHASAAILWRLPWFGPPPQKVHVVPGQEVRAHSTSNLVAHARPAERCETIDGLRVTSLDRTVLDVIRAVPFTLAVAIADAALSVDRSPHPLERGALLALSDRRPRREASARAAAVLEFADGRSGSAGESASRVTMTRAGFPAPLLQERIERPTGGAWYPDFWWPEFGVLGEFDGLGKYRREEYLQGADPADAVIREKRREDELRAITGASMARWGWDVCLSIPRLGAVLARAGLPRRGNGRSSLIRRYVGPWP